MSSCERCWSRAFNPYGYETQAERYQENIKTHNCSPELQAGDDAGWCPDCGRMTLHQHTKECMSPECDSAPQRPVE